jgi:hypothetical protein
MVYTPLLVDYAASVVSIPMLASVFEAPAPFVISSSKPL